MQQIVLKPIQLRQQECIGIYFENTPSLNSIIRKKAGATWSATHKCWHIPLSKEHHETLCAVMKGKALIDQTLLHTYLEDKKRVASKIILPIHQPSANRAPHTVPGKAEKIYAINAHVLPAMHQQLLLKAYSSSTIKTYQNELTQLLLLLKKAPADQLTADDLKRYLVYCYEKLNLTENTLHSRINAMKFYYEQVLKREKFFWDIPRPKKQELLPRIFNQQEIAAIINCAGNSKHKTMLMLAYSAGLRVSEVVGLKTTAIDSKRMTIFVSQAKGKKDRMVSLSAVLLVMLRVYAKEYKPAASGYLFEGATKGRPYSSRSLQQVLQLAKQKAGVLKPGSIHSLRHSFATHLMDRGTDVTMIQKLLGHNDLKTTLRYLYTTNKDLLKIISPLDDLDIH